MVGLTLRKLAIGSCLTLFMLVGSGVSAQAGDKEFFGTGLGAALGGLLGSQFGQGQGQLATTAAGVFVGGLIGQDVGQSLDRSDRLYARGGYGYGAPTYYQPRTYYYETYQPTYVAPPALPPQRVIYVPQEQPVVHYRQDYDQVEYNDRASGYCREYTQQVRIGNRIEESYGTACLQPDGSWQVQR